MFTALVILLILYILVSLVSKVFIVLIYEKLNNIEDYLIDMEDNKNSKKKLEE